MSLHQDLEWRGLIHAATEQAGKVLDGEPVHVYAGFDPSASSLHVGSLLPLMMLARLQRAGHHAVALVGGGTGMIGDPSGKSAERNLLNEQQVAENVAGLRDQISRFLDFERPGNPAILVDNAEWLGRIGLIDFLRDAGKCFTVNYMMAKESVKRRLESESGISYTEFTYLILQAYDYLVLFDRHNVTLQLGGSDQWGNITAGIDLIRSQRAARVHGMVWPLVTKSDGVKFGKTEEGTIWLSAERTSPYRFYQFWINVDDRDAVKYLRYFTFFERAEIEELGRQHEEAPHQRAAQRRLAEEVTRLVHGDDGLARARRATEVFFGGSLDDLSVDEVLDVFKDVPSAELPLASLSGDGLPVVDLLVAADAAKSKGEARRAIDGGGVYLNNRRVEGAAVAVTAGDAIDGRLLVVRKGKKSYYVVKLTGS